MLATTCTFHCFEIPSAGAPNDSPFVGLIFFLRHWALGWKALTKRLVFYLCFQMKGNVRHNPTSLSCNPWCGLESKICSLTIPKVQQKQWKTYHRNWEWYGVAKLKIDTERDYRIPQLYTKSPQSQLPLSSLVQSTPEQTLMPEVLGWWISAWHLFQ